MIVKDQIFFVKVNKKNIEWYLSKGYKCNLKDVIEVKLEDLIPNTRVPIKYECDGCHQIKEVDYCTFNRRHTVLDKLYCAECSRKKLKIEKHYLAQNGYKICNECNRKLPANSDYYFRKCDTKDGWSQKCKECKGSKFTDKLSKIPKDGFKFCIRCNRELPIDIKYFPSDKLCKDGFRNVCRECGADGHFMSEDYNQIQRWTKEEESILIKNYEFYTNDELIELFFPNKTKKSIQDKAYALGITGKNSEVLNKINKEKSKKMSGKNNPNYGINLSDETKKKISFARMGKYKGENNYWFGRKRSIEQKKQISERMKGKWSGDKNPRHKNPLYGEDNPNWQGGITPLYFELRSEIKEWQEESMKACNYRCVLTGDYFDEIHHLYSFRNIVNEVFLILGLDQRQAVKDYSEEEFNKIKTTLKYLHQKYGLGVCLKKEIHKLFHDLYGYKNNIPEQFYEFVNRYKSGEFVEMQEKCS